MPYIWSSVWTVEFWFRGLCVSLFLFGVSYYAVRFGPQIEKVLGHTIAAMLADFSVFVVPGLAISAIICAAAILGLLIRRPIVWFASSMMNLAFLIEEGARPFYFAGLCGIALLAISVRMKHIISGALGAALVAAAFSHWVGPITLPKW